MAQHAEWQVRTSSLQTRSGAEEGRGGGAAGQLQAGAPGLKEPQQGQGQLTTHLDPFFP